MGTLLLGTTVAGKTIWNQRDEILPWVASIQQQLGFGSGAGTTQAAGAAPARTRNFLRGLAVSRISAVPAAPRTSQSASGVAPARQAASMAPARVADTARPVAGRWTIALAPPAAAPAVSRQKSMVSAPASPARASASTVPVPAAAASAFAWQGGSLTANWTNGANWVGNTAPAPGASADIAFTSTPATATASTVDTSYTINSLTFQAGTPAYTIGNANNATLTINGGGITDASANQQTLTLPVALGAAQTWNVSNTGGVLEVDNAITGTGGLTKNGTGTLTLSGANTYTGATVVNAGTLQAGANAPATAFGTNSAVTLANVSGATLDLNGQNETIGSLAGGGLTGDGTTNGSVTLGGATLTVGGDNASTTYSGAISGTGGITKVGTGTLTLNGNEGANTYTGPTTVNAGTLQAGTNAEITAFGTNSAVTLANVSGATLDLNGQNEIIGSLAGGGSTGGNVTLGGSTLAVGGDNTSTTYAGVISGDGGLVKTGTGMLTLTGSNTFSGNTNIETGILAVNGSIAPANSQVSSNLTVYSGATLTGTGSLSVSNVYVNGTLAPGSLAAPGRLVGGGFTTFNLSATSTLSILLGGTVAGSGYSNLFTADSVALDGGALKLTLSGGFVPVAGEQFTIINAAGVSGTFAGGNGATFTDNAGDRYGITYTDFATVLTVLAVPEPSTWALLGVSVGLLTVTLRRPTR